MDSERTRSAIFLSILGHLKEDGKASLESIDVICKDFNSEDFIDFFVKIGFGRCEDDYLVACDTLYQTPSKEMLNLVKSFVLGPKQVLDYQKLLDVLKELGPIEEVKFDGGDKGKKENVRKFVTGFIDVSDIVDRQNANAGEIDGD